MGVHVAGACAPCTRALVRASTPLLCKPTQFLLPCTSARTHACTHAHTPTQAHAQARARTHARAHANTSARSHRAAHTLAPTYSPALTPPAPCSPFFVAALCFAVSQLTKFILNYLETKELHWERLWGSGGASGV